MEEIKVKVKGAFELDIDQMHELQGPLKELTKENYDKFERVVLKHGIMFVKHVWKNPEDKKWYIEDGHQTKRLLSMMRTKGYKIPMIPVAQVMANDEKEAKEAILLANSNYGKMTDEGLYEFLNQSEIDLSFLDDLKLNEIDYDKFKENFFEEPVVGLTDEDSVPEIAESFVKTGEVWQLGNHRLICGDATNVEDIEKLMGEEKADAVWTDPPYNVAYEGGTGLTIKNDDMNDEGFYDLLFKSFSNMHLFTKPGGAIYIAHADTEGMNFRKAMKDAGWLLKQCLIWVKQSLVMGRQDYHWKHEPILYGWAPGEAHNWYADRKQTTVLEFNKPLKNDVHPTMKPVELIEYCLNNSCAPKGLVMDLFGGSGSTLIACEKTHRRCFTSEIDPHYAAVIIERWQQFTGQRGVRL